MHGDGGANGRVAGVIERGRRRTESWPYRSMSLVAGVVALGLALTVVLHPADPVAAFPPAPTFAAPLIAGGHGRFSLQALHGHAVLLNFFQSDCPPCLDEMTTLAWTARTYGARGVRVVAVSTLGDAPDAARRLAQVDRLPFPVIWDAHQDVAWAYGVADTPTSLFIDAQGRLRGQYVGPLDSDRVRDGLRQAGAIACPRCARLAAPVTGALVPKGRAAIMAANVSERPYRAAPWFAARDQRGQLITPASLRGRVVALTFLSAMCTQQCPLVGQNLRAVQRLLGSDASRLVIVAISVAPEQDALQVTRRFAHESGWEGTDWHYLTGPRATLARVWKEYGVYVQAPPPIFKVTGTRLVHQAGLFLIDPRGRLRTYDGVPFLASNVASSVRALLASGS